MWSPGPKLKHAVVPAVIVLAVVVTGVELYGRHGVKDPDHIIRLASAKYQKGVIVVDFDINCETLKQAAARESHSGEWQTNRNQEWRYTPAGYYVTIMMPFPGQRTYFLEGACVRMALPLDAHGTASYSVPLLVPVDYQNYNLGSCPDVVEVQASMVIKHEHREAGAGYHTNGFDGSFAYRRKTVFTGNSRATDVEEVRKRVLFKKGQAEKVSLDRYGVLNVPADTFEDDRAIEFTVKGTPQVIRYDWRAVWPNDTLYDERESNDKRDREKTIELTIPYASLGDWKQLRLTDGWGWLSKIQPAWADESLGTVTVRVPHGGCHSCLG